MLLKFLSVEVPDLVLGEMLKIPAAVGARCYLVDDLGSIRIFRKTLSHQWNAHNFDKSFVALGPRWCFADALVVCPH